MALRSRTRAASVTSGPGRGPASDGRTAHRHRRPPALGRARHRHASAEELRRRAEVLFGERAEEWRESGAGPPDDAGAEEPAVAPDGAGGRRERAALAVRERMPVWLQTRCGLERRSVVVLTVLLVVVAGFAVQHFWAGRTQSVQAPEVVRAAAPLDEQEGEPVAEIVVDVSGKVREPGIHRLPAGSRVADALKAAGGVRPGTNIDGLNRARFLVDGEQVVVGGPAPAAVPAPPGGAPAGGAGGAPAAPVSLSTATVEQLDTLPGVGPVLAQHIIDYRTRHGGFRSVDELREVNGIGERRFADLRNLVRP
ncbi:ComEA family DNA-binding protein [Streptomyces sp. TRM70350]|uniref:ComEA family DNA-binding protein n=1 Tax=Streptomyces sp. TRM70350 TaxID=2856165 RepID=UPI001C4726C8|nr:ComEA family DNA-binding protein [Streptomyces sp. TRM70350]MBV7697657.1 ComEA family DNA-binding protein [Streptomyces sp. TRM70350]